MFPFLQRKLLMATINRTASQFLTLVARQFDSLHFLGEKTLPVFKEDGLLFSPPTQMDQLPQEVQTVVHDNAKNFAHWLKSTRFLEAPLEDPILERERKGSIEESAKNFLMRLNIVRLSHLQPYSEQLLTQVFQDGFNRVKHDLRPDDRETIIYLAGNLQPALDDLPYTYRHLKYKMEFVVSGILNHTGAKVVLTYVSYRIAQWAQPRIYNLLSQTVIPRTVNFLINNTNLSVIHVVSGGVALVQFAYFHYFKASITFYIAKYVSGKIHPLVHRAIVIVENVAFFPGRVISWLVMGPFSLLTSSWKMQKSLAANLDGTKDARKAAWIQEGGVKAHRAWMELMQEGMKARLVPSQKT
jgi:hypothetical protein